MKTNIMTNKARIAFMAFALCTITAINQSIATPLSPSPQVKTRFFVVTAAGSPSNNASLQNAMSYMDKDGVVGNISTNIGEDPAALNWPPLLRGCQILSGPTNFALWDGTNNPTGNFSNQCGSRIGWGFDLKSTNQFFAYQAYFHLWSTEPANTLSYSGNIGTNTANGVALTFSSFLRGELWDADGNKIATYYQGETIADHPINRLIGIIREGYYAPDMTTVASDLNYFKNQMHLTNYAAFTLLDGSGNIITAATNQICTRAYLDNPSWSATDGQWRIQVEGQRHMGFTYYLFQTLSSKPTAWQTINNGPDGYILAGTNNPTSFFRCSESNGLAAAFSPNALVSALPPAVKVWNGEE